MDTSDRILTKEKGLTCRLATSVGTAVLGMFQFGWHTGVINAPVGVLKVFINETTYLREGHGIDPSTSTLLWSLVVSAFTVGGMLGGFVAGNWANRFGRKNGMLYTAVFGILGNLLMALSKSFNSYEMIIAGRVLVGLQCGLYTGLCPLYVSEIAPQNLRGALGVVNQLAAVLGISISQILGIQDILGTADGWPYLLGGTTVILVIQIFGLLFIPKSPRWLLINKDREIDAIRELRKLRGDYDVVEEINEMKEEKTNQESQVSLWSMLTGAQFRRPLLVACVMHMSQQLSGVNGVLSYSTQFFEHQAGLSGREASYATLGVGGIMIVMTFITIPLMDRLGRRPIHLIGLAGMFFSSLGITVSLVVLRETQVDWTKYLAVATELLFVVFFAFGPGSIPWMITAELFSQGPRPSAVSIGVLVNWTSNLVVSLVYPQLEKAIEVYSFLPFTALIGIFFVFLYKFLPETKNRSFEEIEALFSKPTNSESSSALFHGNRSL